MILIIIFGSIIVVSLILIVLFLYSVLKIAGWQSRIEEQREYKRKFEEWKKKNLKDK